MRRYFKKSQTVRLINDLNDTIIELRTKLKCERARVREAQAEARNERVRARNYAHLLAVNGFGGSDHSSGRASSDNASAS